ncbi:hypothetical protein PGTUg99_029187 [Puccinia graminis f. sp. tritici]|uniref:Uncharacterized protein n=1 Tax=Puccinia graminis f. sp. tritici TaxID=56615 RepID=A0A5B0LW58_PUCGR|nr:hypothetical protein PGTUg99_029187 [Puccinia graminis f. sp. tritici]
MRIHGKVWTYHNTPLLVFIFQFPFLALQRSFPLHPSEPDPEAIIRSGNTEQHQLKHLKSNPTSPLPRPSNKTPAHETSGSTRTADTLDMQTAKDWFKSVLKIQHVFIVEAQADVVVRARLDQSFGRFVWAHAECARLMRKECGADATHTHTEESGGALAESLAFRGAGKRGKAGQMRKVPKACCGESRHWQTPESRPTVERGFQCILRRGYKERGHQGAEAGFGADQRRKRRWETCP